MGYICKLIIGLAIKKVKTTLSGMPARKKPKNNGIRARTEAKKIIAEIWKWVFLGVGIGALFHGFFPLQWAETSVLYQRQHL
jgi:uncharacterized membrane protein YraQ (UPF0718 family)